MAFSRICEHESGVWETYFQLLSQAIAKSVQVVYITRVLADNFRQYSKAGLNFILPCFDRAMILVPSSHVTWIADQADSVLNAGAMQIEVLQSDWTLLDPSMARNPIHEILIRRDLTRSLGSLIPDIEEELNVSVDEYWGKDTDNWVEVGAFNTIMREFA